MYQKSRVQSSPGLIFINVELCSFLDLITANIRHLVFHPYELTQRSVQFDFKWSAGPSVSGTVPVVIGTNKSRKTTRLSKSTASSTSATY